MARMTPDHEHSPRDVTKKSVYRQLYFFEERFIAELLSDEGWISAVARSR
jgi:hypothetical protein